MLTAMGHRVRRAIDAGESFLADRQSADGFWRDFALEPGPSEAWTTAYIGWVLTEAPTRSRVRYRRQILAAAEALHSVRQQRGWGYNRAVAADADSTAWACRFLAVIDDYRGLAAVPVLLSYLTGDGQAATYAGWETEAGEWAAAHADVTPVLGLALQAAGADSAVVARLRRAVLAARRADGLWASYWWGTDAYSITQNGEFLAATGGVPGDLPSRFAHWTQAGEREGSTMHLAQCLTAAALLEAPAGQLRHGFCVRLLEQQGPDGGWPASCLLRVPPQRGGQGAGVLYADTARLMGTAMAVLALKRWVRGAL